MTIDLNEKLELGADEDGNDKFFYYPSSTWGVDIRVGDGLPTEAHNMGCALERILKTDQFCDIYNDVVRKNAEAALSGMAVKS